jgi:hypothetical protein
MPRPVVEIHQEVLNAVINPADPELNVCLVGPKYHVVDYPDDKGAAPDGVYAPFADYVGVTGAAVPADSAAGDPQECYALPGIAAGMVVDTSSTYKSKVFLESVKAAIGEYAASTTTLVSNVNILTIAAADDVGAGSENLITKGVAVGDTVRIVPQAKTVVTLPSDTAVNFLDKSTFNTITTSDIIPGVSVVQITKYDTNAFDGNATDFVIAKVASNKLWLQDIDALDNLAHPELQTAGFVDFKLYSVSGTLIHDSEISADVNESTLAAPATVLSSVLALGDSDGAASPINADLKVRLSSSPVSLSQQTWGHYAEHTGTSTGAAATTITLAAGSSTVDDFYNGDTITITSGPGVGETFVITDYVGLSLTATTAAWVTPPTASGYTIGADRTAKVRFERSVANFELEEAYFNRNALEDTSFTVDTNLVANDTICIGDSNGSTNIFPLVPVSVDANAYPIVSANVYFDYRALVSNEASIIEVSTAADVLSSLGKVDPRNPLALAADVAVANGGGVKIKCLPLTSDDSTGYGTALGTLNSDPNIYAMIPLSTDLANVIVPFKNAAVAQSVPAKGKFRIAIGASVALPDTKYLYGSASSSQTSGQSLASSTLFQDAAANYLDASNLVQVGDIFELTESSMVTIASGTATDGAAAAITLAVGSEGTNDFYNGFTITISSGTGAGQTRVITDYDGGTRVATVAAWSTAPVAGSVYSITYGAVTVAAVNSATSLTLSLKVAATAINVDYKITRDISGNQAERISQLNGLIAAHSSPRLTMVYPGTCSVRGFSAQPGYYLSAALAGVIASLPAHQPKNNIGLAAVDSVSNSNFLFDDDEIDSISDAGYFVLIQDTPSSSPYCVHQLTTGQIDSPGVQEFAELSVVQNFDFVSQFFKDRLEPYVGVWNVIPQAFNSIQATIEAGIQDLKNRSVSRIGSPLTNGKLDFLRQASYDAGTLEASIEVNLPKVLNTLVVHIVSA